MQEKRLLLYRTMLEKMEGLIQCNCNYYNIHKIIEQAHYDEEKNEYIVPDPIKGEIQFSQVRNLPPTTINRHALQNNSTSTSKILLSLPTDYEYDLIIPFRLNNNYHNRVVHINSEDFERCYERCIDESKLLLGKTRSKRQEQLLSQNTLLKNTKMHALQISPTENNHMNRRFNPFEAPAQLNRKYGFSSDKQ